MDKKTIAKTENIGSIEHDIKTENGRSAATEAGNQRSSKFWLKKGKLSRNI